MSIKLAQPYHPERNEKIDILNLYSQEHVLRQKTEVQTMWESAEQGPSFSVTTYLLTAGRMSDISQIKRKFIHNIVMNEIVSILQPHTSNTMPDALAIFLKPTNLFFWKDEHKGEKQTSYKKKDLVLWKIILRCKLLMTPYDYPYFSKD